MAIPYHTAKFNSNNGVKTSFWAKPPNLLTANIISGYTVYCARSTKTDELEDLVLWNFCICTCMFIPLDACCDYVDEVNGTQIHRSN